MEEMTHPKGSTPVPDPTLLTTQQLIREIDALRKELNQKVDAEVHATEIRFDGMDTAVKLFRSLYDRLPADIDEKIASLQMVQNEKFASIEKQFLSNKIAVDAAMQAAEKAISEQNKSAGLAIQKSETAAIKQIDQQGLLISTATKALDDKINDIKERLTRMEGLSTGRDTGLGIGWAALLGVGSILSLSMGIIALIVNMKS